MTQVRPGNVRDRKTNKEMAQVDEGTTPPREPARSTSGLASLRALPPESTTNSACLEEANISLHGHKGFSDWRMEVS